MRCEIGVWVGCNRNNRDTMSRRSASVCPYSPAGIRFQTFEKLPHNTQYTIAVSENRCYNVFTMYSQNFGFHHLVILAPVEHLNIVGFCFPERLPGLEEVQDSIQQSCGQGDPEDGVEKVDLLHNRHVLWKKKSHLILANR